MKGWAVIFMFMICVLPGCAPERSADGQAKGGGLTGERPPDAVVRIGGDRYETRLGTYCWSSETQGRCVDTAGPVELLKDERPIPAPPGTEIRFEMDYDPLPNEMHVEQFAEGERTEIAVQDDAFRAPVEPGVYYYTFGVWWMDEERENVAHGDAFYHFVLEVN